MAPLTALILAHSHRRWDLRAKIGRYENILYPALKRKIHFGQECAIIIHNMD
ncbi:MAG: hypothetical protein QGG48_03035 [Desulfatiglandales bacterium]|nr:hypothetical protein [Desulfatiglandales bacterium]